MEELVKWVQTMGAAGAVVFAILYWNERQERREMTKLLLDVTPQALGAIKDVNAAVTMLRVALGAKVEQK